MRAAVIPSRACRIMVSLRRDMSLLTWLQLVWFVVVGWFEYGVFVYSLALCGWEDKALSQSTERPHHVLLVTDPQVRHVPSRESTYLSQFLRWLYHKDLRRNWAYARRLHPDAIVFLGDVLDAGRKISSDEEYSHAASHFRQIFSSIKDVDMHFVPGNEDVGLNILSNNNPHARDHYFKHFGLANRQVSLSNHTLLFLDAPLLVEEDYRRAQVHKSFDEWNADNHGSVEFIRSFKSEKDHKEEEPVILFTHIPLFRPDTASCGPLRERGSIHRGAGPGYQNTLGKLTTQFIFEHVKPSLVFSGDDRDYCEYTHSQPHSSGVREITVKSFSPYKNARYTGFHLLSLVPPPQNITNANPSSSTHTFTDSPCFLPAQTPIYSSLSILTLFLLAVATLRQRRSRYTPLLPSNVAHRGKRSPSPVRRKGRGPMSPLSISVTSSWPRDVERPSLRSKEPESKRYSPARWIAQFLSDIFNNFLIIISPAFALGTLIAWTCR